VAARSVSCTRWRWRWLTPSGRARWPPRSGERIVLGAFEDESLIGTATLVPSTVAEPAPSGRNRKNDDAISHRGRGVAKALMRTAENVAVERGRTLLVLDTAADGGASFVRGTGLPVGECPPDYASSRTADSRER